MVDIEKAGIQRDRVCHIDAVNVIGDRGLGGVVLRDVEPDAADRDRIVEPLALGDNQAWNLAVQIDGIDDIGRVERLAGDCGDRFRRLLNIDLALLRNEDDFFQGIGRRCRRLVLRPRWDGREETEQRSRDG